MLQGETEELRTALEQAERARKNAENELYEASDRVNELSAEVSSAQGQKRKHESDMQAMQVSYIMKIINKKEAICPMQNYIFQSLNTALKRNVRGNRK